MIGCFFKCLTVRSDAVVGVARDALASVIAASKLQKELLQASLRPILLNLADYRKLSVPLLKVGWVGYVRLGVVRCGGRGRDGGRRGKGRCCSTWPTIAS
jgi:hypothetical protein